MKILIMGLPGSGKTHLATRLQSVLCCARYDGSEVRKMANDWDFTKGGRERQASRMKTIADFESKFGRTVICDFVCPTKSTRLSFDPNVMIWMDTIKASNFITTNEIFEEPTDEDFNYTVDQFHIRWFLTDKEIEDLASQIFIKNKMKNEGKL